MNKESYMYVFNLDIHYIIFIQKYQVFLYFYVTKIKIFIIYCIINQLFFKNLFM